MTDISRLSSLLALIGAVLLTLSASTSLLGADLFQRFDWNGDGVLSGNEGRPFLVLDLEPERGPDGNAVITFSLLCPDSVNHYSLGDLPGNIHHRGLHTFREARGE